MPGEITTPISNIEVLLAKMVEQKAGADELGKMMDLFERWQAGEASKAFALDMNGAQQELRPVIKDLVNSHAKSMYAALATVQEAIRPVYLRHGFSISWSQGDPPGPGMTRVIATLFHTSGHSERYQGDYPIDGVGAKGGSVMNPLQGTVSAHTYAQKDMLRLMFNLTIAGQDKDGNGHGPEMVTEAQVREINQLLEALGYLAEDTYNKFLAWLAQSQGVPSLESLADLDAKTAAKALAFLRGKKGAAK